MASRTVLKLALRDPLHPSPPNNLMSATEMPDVVEEKFGKEIQAGRISGPWETPPFNELIISPLGLVPKKSPGEFRLIHHLSHPQGRSTNSGISKEISSVQYTSLDDAVNIVMSLGPGCYLAKTDIKSAFRIIPWFGSSPLFTIPLVWLQVEFETNFIMISVWPKMHF